ncbi:hypothetical protein PC112_g1778 [Phytophthora cactorum]|nr:hypothetical protein PC112_g1778 [Phytophthora cactorum]
MDVHWVEYYQNMKTNGVDQSDETKSEDNDDMTGGEKVENQDEEEKMKSTYKAVVTGSKDDAWNALKCMGVQLMKELSPWFVFGNQKPVVNPQSKKSDYDVIRMFTDMRNEVGMRSEQDYLNFKFIYYTSLKDKSALTAIAREGPSALN